MKLRGLLQKAGILCDFSIRGPKLFQKGVSVSQPKMTKALKELRKGTLKVFDQETNQLEIEGKQLLRYKKPLDPEIIRPQDAYLLIDTNMEAFFNKRTYSLKNFNFYLKALAEQKKSQQAVDTLEKMKALGVQPTRESYVLAMTACAKEQNIKKVEELMLHLETDLCKTILLAHGFRNVQGKKLWEAWI